MIRIRKYIKIEITREQARQAAESIPAKERVSSIICFAVFAIGFW